MVYGRGSNPGLPGKYRIPFIQLDHKKIDQMKKERERKRKEAEGKEEREPEEQEHEEKEERAPEEATTQILPQHREDTTQILPKRGGEDTTQILPKQQPKKDDEWSAVLFPRGQADSGAPTPQHPVSKAEPIQLDMPLRERKAQDKNFSLFPRGQGDIPPEYQPRDPHELQLFPTGQGEPPSPVIPPAGPPRTIKAREANARRRANPIQLDQPLAEPPKAQGGSLFPEGQAPSTDKASKIPPGQERYYDEKGSLQHLPMPPGGWGPGGAPKGHPDYEEPKAAEPTKPASSPGPLFPTGQEPGAEPAQGLGTQTTGNKVKEAAKVIGKETVKGAVQGALLGAAVPVAGETGVSEAGGAVAGGVKGAATGIAKAAGKGAVKGAVKGSMGPLFPPGQEPDDTTKKYR